MASPTLDEYLAQARPLNPDYTDAEIIQEYENEYGRNNDPSALIPFDQYLSKSRTLNPDYSDDEIRSFWEEDHGKRGAPEVTPKDIGISGTLLEGAKSTGRSLKAAGQTYFGSDQGLIDTAKAQQEAPKDPALDALLQDIQKRKDALGKDAGWLETAGAFGKAALSNPKGAGLMALEQLPNTVAALGTAGAGALAGSALGPVGTVAGGLAGMFLANVALETGGYALNKAADGTVTPEERAAIKKEGLIKGSVVSATDAATLGVTNFLTGTVARATERAVAKTLIDHGVDVANHAAVQAARANPQILRAVQEAALRAQSGVNTLGKKIGRGTAALGVESLGEGAGEYIGEYAATGEGDKMEAVIEAFAGLSQSAGEVAATGLYNKTKLTSIPQRLGITDPNVSLDETIAQSQAILDERTTLDRVRREDTERQVEEQTRLREADEAAIADRQAQQIAEEQARLQQTEAVLNRLSQAQSFGQRQTFENLAITDDAATQAAMARDVAQRARAEYGELPAPERTKQAPIDTPILAGSEPAPSGLIQPGQAFTPRQVQEQTDQSFKERLAQERARLVAMRDRRLLPPNPSDESPGAPAVSTAEPLKSAMDVGLQKAYPAPRDVRAEVHSVGFHLDTPVFREYLKQVTGKEVFSDLSPQDLQKLHDALQKIKPAEQSKPGAPIVPKQPVTRVEKPSEPVTTIPEAQVPRSELPPEQNAEMRLRAEKAQADLEIAGQERGGRTFLETQGQGGTQETIGFKSATADWYKELTTGPRPLKRSQIETAIQKIIKDQGADVGKAVELVKEALLRDREFNRTPWGEDADAIARGEWPSWIEKPTKPETRKKAKDTTPSEQMSIDVASASYGDLVRLMENGVEARRRLNDLPPVQKQEAMGFIESGMTLTPSNIEKWLESNGSIGYVDPTVKQIQKNYKDALAAKMELAATRELNEREKTGDRYSPRKTESTQDQRESFSLTTPKVNQSKAKTADRQTSIEIPPETIGSRPIIGREAQPEEAPLFSKAAQEPEAEQTTIDETPASPQKEAWEMTREEFLTSPDGFKQSPAEKIIGRRFQNSADKDKAETYHKFNIIQPALRDGLPVPKAVLADYPDLQPKRQVGETPDTIAVTSSQQEDPTPEPVVPRAPTEILASALRQAADQIEGKPKRDTSMTGLEDTGEKIGGARKDKWAERGLTLSDLEGMTGGEEAKFIVKANIWKPDYAAMVSTGTEPKAAALVKIIYDRLAAKPAKDTPEGRRHYLTMMGHVKDVLGAVKTVEDAKNVQDRIFQEKLAWGDKGWKDEQKRATLHSVYKNNADPFRIDWKDQRKADKMVAEGFPAQAPWTRRYRVFQEHHPGNLTEHGAEIYAKRVPDADPWKSTFSNEQDLAAHFQAGGVWTVTEKGGKIIGYRTDKASAETLAAETYENKKTAISEEGEEPSRPHLDTLTRTGEDYRQGRDVTAEDFRTAFGFRGVEFGNWAASDERQKHINQAYDALMDLANVLDIPPQAVSLNGTLGIAFGARGGGGAMAHYEPSKLVINITKINGPGAMAHEWGHALDHYFGEIDKPNAYQGAPTGISGWRGSHEGMRRENLRPEMRQAFGKLMGALFTRDRTKAERIRDIELKLETVKTALAKAEAAKHETSDWKKYILRLKDDVIGFGKMLTQETGEDKPAGGYGKVNTSYFKEASKLSGKTGDYWKRPTEMFARAFESYVFDKLGRQSQYLVHGVEPSRFTEGYKGNPYPQGTERTAINQAFDKLFDIIEHKETEKGVALFDLQAKYGLTEREGQEDNNSYVLREGEQRELNFDLASEAISDLNEVVDAVSTTGRDLPTARTVALGISPELIHQGVVDLTGRQLSSLNELAKIAQVYRDPRFETFRIFYIRGKNIVGHEGTTSRMPGLVKVFKSIDGVDSKIASMRSRMEALGADGYYLLHNHPSGNSNPSQEDIKLTRVIAERLPGFRGHVVIDSNEYSTLDFVDGDLETGTHRLDLGEDHLLSPSISHPLLDTTIGSSADVVSIGKSIQAPSGFVTVIYASRGISGNIYSRVRAIQEVSAEFFTNGVRATEYLKSQATAFGSTSIFVHASRLSADLSYQLKPKMDKLIQIGLVRDYIVSSDNDQFSQSRAEQGVGKASGYILGSHISNIPSDSVAEAESSYQSTLYDVPELSKLDDVIRLIQDKNIDLVRLVDAIKDAHGEIADDLNPVLKEELYLGRVMHQNENFLTDELKPLIQSMRLQKVSIKELDTYLHARHAKEANAYLRSINEDRQDDTEFWAKPSGMTDAEADRILASADAKMRALADRVDKIVDGTRKTLVKYGLEKQETVDAWAQQYQHYVPLYREGKEQRMGTGQGRSVRGPSSKQRTGSTRAVEDILAHIAMDREKAIVRGEKMRPVLALAWLLKKYPNDEIAKLAKPTTVSYTDPETGLEVTMPGQVGEYNVPTIAYKDPRTGQVVHRPDPAYKGRDNVVNFRVNGEDRAIIFNEDNPRAVAMASALKDLDVGQLNKLLSAVGSATRYMAAVNTQYNPIFGIVNFIRDAQFAMLSLSSTPLKGKQAQIVNNARKLMAGIYTDARAVRKGEHPTSAAAQLWERFQTVGGPTGYRDLFRTSADRAKAIRKLLDPDWWQKTAAGKLLTGGGVLKTPASFLFSTGGKKVLDWLSDYNLTMENAMRLAVFKTGIDAGLSDEKAASLAKNITVNFNKKGQISAQAGALYAFFNASVQGTARLAKTLFEPGQVGKLSAAGKKIVAGGVLLGILQAMWLAMAGFDDDEPPEFVKTKNLILPAPGTEKGYISVPMPLGFHVLPAFGRLATEAIIHGNPGKKSYDFLSALTDSFSPVGSSSSLAQTLAPTVTDPIVALSENKDWTGKPIYREDFNKLRPTPGFQRAKDSATPWARGLSEMINYVSGGTDYAPGKFSPTPDEIDYLVGQATGGVGREASKAMRTATGLSTGEEVPLHAVPLVGRFIGSSGDESGVRNRFYENVRRLNEEEAELKGRREHGEDWGPYLSEHPDVRYADAAQKVEREIAALTKRKRELVRRGANREMVKLIEQQIQTRMARINQLVGR